MSNYLHLWVQLFDMQMQISNLFIFIRWDHKRMWEKVKTLSNKLDWLIAINICIVNIDLL